MLFAMTVFIISQFCRVSAANILNVIIQKDKDDFLMTRHVDLSPDYNVKWVYDKHNSLLNFTTTVRTLGYCGFGISTIGKMDKADIIIGGVADDIPYFTDRHGTANGVPPVDGIANWFLDFAYENETHTVMQFHRLVDTCDPQDVRVKEGTMKFLWSYGSSDAIGYHESGQRGAKSVDILAPPDPLIDLSGYTKWTAPVTATVPPEETIYYCSIYKTPSFHTKRHIVSFDIILDTPEAIEFNHHILLLQCLVPREKKEIEAKFANLVGEGGLCNDDQNEISSVLKYCNNRVYGWAVGADPLILPEHMGYPINEDGVSTYYMVQYHWNNPEKKAGMIIRTGINMHITEKLREHDCGWLSISHAPVPTLIIPPDSENFVVPGHCDAECTSAKIPPAGIYATNYYFHSHLAARSIKLRHFRSTPDQNRGTKVVELEPIANEPHYDFNYQECKPLRTEVQILPGDQLSAECTYDTTWRTPSSVTLGGLGTMDEMCNTHLLYYPRMKDLEQCSSYINPLELALMFSITGVNLVNSLSNIFIKLTVKSSGSDHWLEPPSNPTVSVP